MAAAVVASDHCLIAVRWQRRTRKGAPFAFLDPPTRGSSPLSATSHAAVRRGRSRTGLSGPCRRALTAPIPGRPFTHEAKRARVVTLFTQQRESADDFGPTAGSRLLPPDNT